MVLDLKAEMLRLAMERITAGVTELRAIALEELTRRSMDDLTAGRLATVADKLETVVAVLNETILSRQARQGTEE
jgi:hypothetical protein